MHAIKRAKERYDLDISRRDLKDMCIQIRSGHAIKLEQLSTARAEYIVKCQDKDVRVIYDKNKKSIVTFLPPGEDERDNVIFYAQLV